MDKDSLLYIQVADGCGSSSCRRGRAKGMMTNGPCNCWTWVDPLQARIKKLEMALFAVGELTGDQSDTDRKIQDVLCKAIKIEAE